MLNNTAYTGEIGLSHLLTLYVDNSRRNNSVMVKINHVDDSDPATQLCFHAGELVPIINKAKQVIVKCNSEKIRLKGSQRRIQFYCIGVDVFEKKGGVKGVIISYFHRKSLDSKWERTKSGVKITQAGLNDLSLTVKPIQTKIGELEVCVTTVRNLASVIASYLWDLFMDAGREQCIPGTDLVDHAAVSKILATFNNHFAIQFLESARQKMQPNKMYPFSTQSITHYFKTDAGATRVYNTYQAMYNDQENDLTAAWGVINNND